MTADDLEHDQERPTDPRERRGLPVWQEGLLLVGLAVVLAFVIKAVLAQAFYIPSDSMQPGLVQDDRILVQKASYWFGGEPERGDIVVFEDPGGWLGPSEAEAPQNPVGRALSTIGLVPSEGHLVKRVIGVEGDVVTCCDARGRILVNGVAIDERAYATAGQAKCFGPMTGTCDWSAGPVPEDAVFVMGDNRSRSGDSTAQMCTEAETDCVPGREFVDGDLVVGKVSAVLWPFSHLRRLGGADSFADVPPAS